MKNKLIFLLSALWGFVLSGLLLPPAHAQHDTASDATPVKTTDMAPRRGTLYRIRHQGNTAYLFGTIHVGKPAFFPLEHETTLALARAGKLVVEIDIRNGEPFQRALQKHGMYPANDSLERHLSPDNLGLLRRMLDKFGIPFDRVSRMKPWLVTNLLIGLDLEGNGYQRRHGIETFLLSAATAQSKTVQELESADYQMSLFDEMTEAEQEQYLHENLTQIDDGNALKKAQSLIDAWAGANGNALEQALHETLDEKTLSAGFLRRILLDKRNPEMASKIEALLKSEGTTFVGVGLFHLVGETGLPKLLRQRGYEVEKLY